eukprot:6206920-Pleurochrysis_carterae.AAC.1
MAEPGEARKTRKIPSLASRWPLVARHVMSVVLVECNGTCYTIGNPVVDVLSPSDQLPAHARLKTQGYGFIRAAAAAASASRNFSAASERSLSTFTSFSALHRADFLLGSKARDTRVSLRSVAL